MHLSCAIEEKHGRRTSEANGVPHGSVTQLLILVPYLKAHLGTYVRKRASGLYQLFLWVSTIRIRLHIGREPMTGGTTAHTTAAGAIDNPRDNYTTYCSILRS